MMIEETRAHAKSMLSMLISFALIASALYVFNAAPAHADEPTGPAPTALSLSSYSFGNQANIEFYSDYDVSNYGDGESVKLYEVGTTTPVGSPVTSGEYGNFSVPVPTTGYKQYLVKLGSLVSNRVTVSAYNPWTVNLYSYNSSFSTDDDNPSLSWNSYSSFSSQNAYGLYIVDLKDNSIVYKSKNDSSWGQVSVPRFYTGDGAEYMAYVADWNATAAETNDLNNIQYISGSAKIKRTPWWAGITVSQAESDPKLKITTNQTVADSHPQNPVYALYVVDETDHVILTENSTMGTDYEYQVTGLNSGERHQYAAYIAAYTATMPTDPDDLQDLQFKSNPVNAQKDGWDVNLDSDSNTYLTDQATPHLLWQTNKELNSQTSTNFGFYIVKDDDEIVYKTNTGGNSGSFQIPRLVGQQSGMYTAYIATWDSGATTLNDLEDIQISSAAVEIDVAPWILNIKATSATATDPSQIKVQLNQPINDPNTTATTFELYVIDDNGGTGKILAGTTSVGKSFTFTLPDEVADSSDFIYAAIGSAMDPAPQTVDDIWQNGTLYAQSNPVQVDDEGQTGAENNWSINLTPDVTSFTNTEEVPTLNWSTNKELGATSDLGIFIVDKNSGAVVYKSDDESGYGSYTPDRFFTEKSKKYIAYIANWDEEATTYNTLTGVVASSRVSTIHRQTWKLSLFPDPTQWKILYSPNQNLSSNLDPDQHYALYLYDTTTDTFLDTNTTATGSMYGGYNLNSAGYTLSADNDGDVLIGYIAAKTASTPQTVDDLTNVQAESKPTVASTNGNQLQISLGGANSFSDHYASGPTLSVFLDWAKLPSNKTVYIVDQKTNVIVTRSRTSNYVAPYPNALGQYNYVVPENFLKESNVYQAYMADTDPAATTMDDLTHITSTSQPSTFTYRQPTGTLDLYSPDTLNNDNGTASIAFRLNAGSFYTDNSAFYIVKKSTGQIIKTMTPTNYGNSSNPSPATTFSGYISASGSAYDVTVPTFYEPHATEDYVGYFADVNPQAQSVNQLVNIRSTTNTVRLKPTPLLIDVSVANQQTEPGHDDDATYKVGDNIRFYWRANQDINIFGGYKGGGYKVYAVNTDTGDIEDSYTNVVKNSYNSYTIGNASASSSVDSTVYTLVVAPDTPGATNIDDLPAGQIHSADLTYRDDSDWDARITSMSFTNATCKVHINSMTSSQDPSQTAGHYQYYVVDTKNGNVIAASPSQSYLLNHDFAASCDGTHTYKLYIAERQYDENDDEIIPGNKSEFEDILSDSFGTQPDEEDPETTDPGEETGDGNPSEDCTTDCDSDDNFNPATQSYVDSKTDITLPGIAGFGITRGYDSVAAKDESPFGKGWSANFNMGLSTMDNENQDSLADAYDIEVTQENGSTVTFTRNGTHYTAPDRVFATLTYDIDADKFVFTRTDGTKIIFDQTGLLAQIKDRNGNALTFHYNTENQLTQITNNKQQQLTFAWNTDNHVTSITDTSGRTVTYTYDPTTKLLTAVDLPEARNNLGYGYNTDGLLDTSTNLFGGTTHLTYTDGHLTKIVDALGNQTKYAYFESTTSSGEKQSIINIMTPDNVVELQTYNDSYQLVKDIRNALGTNPQTTTYAYGTTGQAVTITNPDNTIVTNTYDYKGNLMNTTKPGGASTSISYNDFNEPTSILENGKNTVTTYDSHGNVTAVTTQGGDTTVYDINPDGTINWVETPQNVATGKKTTYGYDAHGNVNSITDPRGNTTTSQNNISGKPTQTTDPLGNVTQTTYDPDSGNVTDLKYPNNTHETTVYADSGAVASKTDNTGITVSYTYDANGNIIAETTPLGVTHTTYDGMGRPTSKHQDYDNKTYTTIYDAYGNIVEATDAAGKTTKTTYRWDGLKLSDTDAKNQTTTYEYDARGNLTKTTHPDQTTNVNTYNSWNQLPQTNVNEVGQVTHYSYDNAGRLVFSYNGSKTSSYQYDREGRPTSYNNFYEKETYTYDANGNQTTYTNVAGEKTTYTYNANNQLTSKKFAGKTVAYTYDTMGNTTGVGYTDLPTAAGLTNTFDPRGNLTQSTRDGKTITYTYDNLNRMTFTGTPATVNTPANGVAYGYNTAGNINAITYPNGTNVTYTYTPDNLVSGVKVGNNPVVNYTYDNNRNETTAAYANGLNKQSTYDNSDNQTGFQLIQNGQTKYQQAYTVDNLGRLTGSTTDQQQPATYTYDNTNRLNTAASADYTKQYSYDNQNNILGTAQYSISNQYGNRNQITSSGFDNSTHTYDYDKQGRRTTESIMRGSNLKTTRTYTWQQTNALDSVQQGATNIAYTYNADGLLDSRVSSKTSTLTSNSYTWDTNRELPTLLTDSTNTYIYGNNTTPVASINNTTNAITYLYTDRAGSVTYTADETGAKIMEYKYDPYGNTINSAANDENRFRYVGQYQDADTGLYYMRARWYDPKTAQFLSIDPLLSQTHNAYNYTLGDPLNSSDLDGMASRSGKEWSGRYSYYYRTQIGTTNNETTSHVLKTFRDNFLNIFPFQITGCSKLKTGGECDLHAFRFKGLLASSMLLTWAVLTGNVLLHGDGHVKVTMTHNGFYFTVQSSNYFDEPGSVIRFAIGAEKGKIYLAQKGASDNVYRPVARGVNAGAAAFTWAIQAANLKKKLGFYIGDLITVQHRTTEKGVTAWRNYLSVPIGP